MSWCCLALRSSAEQKGNKASTEMAEASRLRTRGGAIRSGKTSPKSQPAGARAPLVHPLEIRSRISAPHADLGLVASWYPRLCDDANELLDLRFDIGRINDRSQAVSLQLSPDDRSSVSIDSRGLRSTRPRERAAATARVGPALRRPCKSPR